MGISYQKLIARSGGAFLLIFSVAVELKCANCEVN